MNSDRKDLLDYVRTLNGQEANDAKVHGINTWLIVGAELYLMNEGLAIWAQLRAEHADLGRAIELSGYLCIAMYSAILIWWTLVQPGQPLNERFRAASRRGFVRSLLFGIAVLIPTAGFIIWRRALPAPPGLEVQLSFLYWTWLIIGTSTLVGLVSDYVRFEAIEQPAVSGVGDRARAVQVALGIVVFGGSLLFAAQLASDALPTPLAPGWERTVRFACVVNLALLTLLALFRILARASLRQEIEGLERDIVIGGIDEAEIRKRLEYLIVGKALGAWVTDQLQEVRRRAEVFRRNCSVVADRHKAIDVVARHDRSAALDEMTHLVGSISDSLRAYNSANERLVRWLRASLMHLQLDSQLAKMGEDAAEELNRLSLVAQEEHTTATNLLHRLLSRLKEG